MTARTLLHFCEPLELRGRRAESGSGSGTLLSIESNDTAFELNPVLNDFLRDERRCRRLLGDLKNTTTNPDSYSALMLFHHHHSLFKITDVLLLSVCLSNTLGLTCIFFLLLF
ncbi:hypothetical protein PV327_006415 [Microctonus hyperodae]|uniref:Uncharacterized protein n=1 Tax=Microctonus hyperodae TaxID=165561 RepID=A0AA39KIA1_MICHY|nr:hypothetical protein PV327_006415 [Microctonus hyperodae]